MNNLNRFLINVNEAGEEVVFELVTGSKPSLIVANLRINKLNELISLEMALFCILASLKRSKDSARA